MKQVYTRVIILLIMFLGILPALTIGQVSVKLTVLHTHQDSVVLKAEMTATTAFQLEAVYLAVGYDPAKFYVTDSRGIMNHAFNSQFTMDSRPRFDTNKVIPDIALYGESHPSFGFIPIPATTVHLCNFTFFPKATLPFTTSFTIEGNTPTAATSGYWIPQSIDNQPFSPAFGLNNVVVPVELSAFTAVQQGTMVVLQWTTVSESGNHGFHVQRRGNTEDPSWETLDFVKGHGNSREDKQYIFLDNKLERSGTYEYRLRQVDFDGTQSYSSSRKVEYRSGVQAFALEQGYPNPVVAGAASTVLRYSVAERSDLRLVVVNALGREVSVLRDFTTDAGSYSAIWNPVGFPPGLYMAKLTAHGVESGITNTAHVKVNVIR